MTRNPYPSHYRTAFASSTILRPQTPQVALRLPCLLLAGGLTGLPRSAWVTSGQLRCTLSAGRLAAHDRRDSNSCTADNRPSRVLSLARLTTFSVCSHMLTILLTLALFPATRPGNTFPSRVGCLLWSKRYIVREASTGAIARCRRSRRVLLMGQQVLA